MAPDKSPDESTAKLKELEAVIAKELEQKITLSQPTDPRLDGTVQHNPQLDTKKPEVPASHHPSTQSSPPAADTGKKVDDITLEEVDALLNDVDEGFGNILQNLKSEVGQLQFDQNFESLSISAEYLKDDKDEAVVEAVVPPKAEHKPAKVILPSFDQRNFLRQAVVVIFRLIAFPAIGLLEIAKHAWNSRTQPFKQILLGLPAVLKAPAFAVAVEWKSLAQIIKRYPPAHFIKLVVLVGLVYGLKLVVVDMVYNLHTPPVKDPFLKSFEEVASEKRPMVPDAHDDRSAPIPEFVVGIPRIIATLQTDSPAKHPMAAVEFFIEGSDREAVVEISKRKTEIRDMIERIIEQMTFSELDTVEGKDRLKLRIRLATNKLLNNGHAKQIFLKSIQIHE